MEKPEFVLSQRESTENRSDSLKNKLQKGAVVLAAFTALAGEACSPNKGNDTEQVGGRDKQTEVQKEYMSPNPALLAEYRHNIHTGNFPAEGQKERTLARALEIVILKGVSIGKESRVEVEPVGTVPVQIKIDGQVVPVGPDDYTDEELKIVRLGESISNSMGSITGKNSAGYLESEERISPLAEKIFKKTEKRSDSGKKIYTSPDLGDFSGDGNKPEKRKSKSDF